MIRICVATAALALACTTTQQMQQMDWRSEDVIRYRLLTRDDFEASHSNKLWGNVAHGAEVCVTIRPADDYVKTARFEAALKRGCSYWNDGFGRTLFNVGMAAASVAGLPSVLIGSHDPEYVLQHEQLHFAIMHLQALRLSRATAKDPDDPYRIRRLHQQVAQRANEMNAQLDADTSGNAASFESLERWVRLMERNMEKWCGRGPECRVRTPDWEAIAASD